MTFNPFNNYIIIGVQWLRLETIGSNIIAPSLVFILIVYLLESSYIKYDRGNCCCCFLLMLSVFKFEVSIALFGQD